MPRNSRQRGDKHGPFGATARRKGRASEYTRTARRAGPATAARDAGHIDIDEFMEGYSSEEAGGMLQVGGVAIRCNAEGQVRHVRRRGHPCKIAEERQANGEEEGVVALGSPQGGATVDTAAWGEASSDTSSDGEESGLADFAANVAGRSSSGEYEGLLSAMQRFGATDIGGGGAPEDLHRGGLIGGGSSGGSGSSAEDTDTTGRDLAPAGVGSSDADINDSDGGGWPLSGLPGKRRKGGAGRGLPGEVRQLKKARRAALRAARADRRGFDLGAVDRLLRDFVRDEGDLMGLPVKAGRVESAAVHRLAALYGLKCSAQGGGKKQTIMVVATTHRTRLADPSEVAALVRHQAALSARGARLAKLAPGTQPAGAPLQPPRRRSTGGAGCGGRGGGGRRFAAGGRPNGSGSAPPSVPAYLQPMKFISSGTMQTDEEVPSEQMRPGVRPAPMEASAAAMAASTLNLEEGGNAADTAEDADSVGVGHRGLGSPARPPPLLPPSPFAATPPAGAAPAPVAAADGAAAMEGGEGDGAQAQPQEAPRGLAALPDMSGALWGRPMGESSSEDHGSGYGSDSSSGPGISTSSSLPTSVQPATVVQTGPPWQAMGARQGSGLPPPSPRMGGPGLPSSMSATITTGFDPVSPEELRLSSPTGAFSPTGISSPTAAALLPLRAGSASGAEKEEPSVERPSFCSWLGLSGPAATRAAAALAADDAAADAEAAAQISLHPDQGGARRSHLGLPSRSGSAADDEMTEERPPSDRPSDQAPSFHSHLRQLRNLSMEAQDRQHQQEQVEHAPPMHMSATSPPTVSPAMDVDGDTHLRSGGGEDDFMTSVLAAAQQLKSGGAADGIMPRTGGEAAPGRRPAIGLMTPNETKKQVTAARKKEAKLARRAQREALQPATAAATPSGHAMLSPPLGRDDTAGGDPARSAVGTRYGGFEQHTTGFGSKMLAKWGFGGAGSGLGRSQQGIAEPIAAVQRAKKLGLGAG